MRSALEQAQGRTHPGLGDVVRLAGADRGLERREDRGLAMRELEVASVAGTGRHDVLDLTCEVVAAAERLAARRTLGLSQLEQRARRDGGESRLARRRSGSIRSLGVAAWRAPSTISPPFA